MNIELEQEELSEASILRRQGQHGHGHRSIHNRSPWTMPVWALVKFTSTIPLLPGVLSDCLILFLSNANFQLSLFKSFRPKKHFFSDGGDFELPCSELAAWIS